MIRIADEFLKVFKKIFFYLAQNHLKVRLPKVGFHEELSKNIGSPLKLPEFSFRKFRRILTPQ